MVSSALSPATDLRPVWISVDEEENDPVRFVAVLAAAFARIDSRCGAEARRMLAGAWDGGGRGVPSWGRQVLDELMNDISELFDHDVVLVLDDLHRITEPAAFAALDRLLERMPPVLHIVMVTRHDPPLALARLRARAELAEMRFSDLRFTMEEAGALLSAQTAADPNGAPLSGDDITLGWERTEGWAAGLRLLATALAGRPGSEERAALFTGRSQADRYMFDFLAEEVLAAETAEVQEFLMETSILDRLTPAACSAVSGNPDAPALLDDLERRNLFVVPTYDPDGPGRTVRYHDLFATFLGRQLRRRMPERIPELHRRAADAAAAPSEAIGHLLDAGLVDRAANAIQAMGGPMLQQGLIVTVRGWIERLPESVFEAHPRLLYLLGLCAWQTGSVDEGRALFEQAAGRFEVVGDKSALGQTLTYLSLASLAEADTARSIELGERALSLPLPADSRVKLLLNRIRAQRMHGALTGVDADLDEVIALVRQQPDPRTLAAIVTHLNPVFASIPGGVDRFERTCGLARAYINDSTSPARVAFETQRSLVYLWRGRLDDFLQAGDRTLTLRDRYGSDNPWLDLWLLAMLGMVAGGQGDGQRAMSYLDRGVDLADEMPSGDSFRSTIQYPYGFVCWMLGRFDNAHEAHARMVAATTPGELATAPALRATLQGLLHISQGEHEVAVRVLRRAVDEQERVPRVVMYANPRLALAHLLILMDRRRDALTVFTPTLHLCERENTGGFILLCGSLSVQPLRLAIEQRISRDFAARLLDAVEAPVQPKPVAVAATGEALSAREMEILRLLVGGATNREIAEQLFIGDQTVKTHVSESSGSWT